jgi:hypothetical protein
MEIYTPAAQLTQQMLILIFVWLFDSVALTLILLMWRIG